MSEVQDVAERPPAPPPEPVASTSPAGATTTGNVSAGAVPPEVQEQLAPVLQGTADAVGGARDALLVEDAVNQLNSDGDTVYMRVTAEAKVDVQVGGKAQLGGDIAITQNGDGTDATYTVRVGKHALGALTGQISIPFVPLKAEIGVQTNDAVEMTFATREEATRAAQLVQRLAVADVASDLAGSTVPGMTPGMSGGGSNPLANPLTGSGAPGELATAAVGLTAEDKAFLQDNITAYEQTLGLRERVAIEGKLPLVGVFGAAAEGRLDPRQQIIRRVELPTDTEAGSLTYTVSGDLRLSAKEKLTIGPNGGEQFVAGVQVQNRLELAQARASLSFTYDIPAGNDPTRSPVGGTPVPEADLLGELGQPDRITAEIQADWRDQSLLDPSRGDGHRGTLTMEVENPEALPEALNAFLSGDPESAAGLAGATVTGEIQSIERSGVNGQGAVRVQLGEGNSAEVSVIVEAGVDDVVGTRRLTFRDGEDVAAEPAPAPMPAEQGLVVVPRDGLTLRDGPDGNRVSVFQNGTFLRQTGEAVTDAQGRQWVPVSGTDVNDAAVEGYVAAEHVRPHSTATGEMDATGRTNPALEAQRYAEVQVQAGDNLWDLARQNNVDFNEMVALNRDHLIDPALIFAGDTVYIPGTAQGPAPEAQPAPAPVPQPQGQPSVESEETGETTVSPNTSGTGSGSSAPSPAPTIPPPVAPPSNTGSGGTSAPDDTTAAPATPAEPAPAGTTGRPDLGGVLADYQVPPDETATWRPDVLEVLPEWAEGPAAWLGDRIAEADIGGTGDLGRRLAEAARNGFGQDFAASEVRLLDELNTLDQLRWYDITDTTGNRALEAVPRPDGNTMDFATWNNDGHVDAYRHALWNARMTQAFGEDWTEAYATAHEQVAGNPAAREAMDLYNNEVGRRIARENPGADDAELGRLIQEAMQRGELLVIDRNGEIQWSDQVAIGEHGQAREGEAPGNQDMLDRNLERDTRSR